MVAVVGINAELLDKLIVVFAPVLDVDESVVQRSSVVTCEGVDLAEGLRGGEDIGRDDLVKKAGELAVCEADTVQCFEFHPEVPLQPGSVADIRAVDVFQANKLLDECIFNVLFPEDGGWGFRA